MATDSFGLMEGLQVVGSVVSLPGNYQNNRKRGMDSVTAGADAVADAAAVAFLNPITYGVGSITKSLASVVYKGFQRSNINIRAVNTPFSQRFEHTRTTSNLQSFALRRMGAMSGMGNEASQMYGNF